jgi:glycosyltransferase involved in cell wall biosynthesis
VDALRRAITGLARDEMAHRRLSCAGRERVREQFTQDRIAADTLLFYRALLAGRGS